MLENEYTVSLKMITFFILFNLHIVCRRWQSSVYFYQKTKIINPASNYEKQGFHSHG